MTRPILGDIDKYRAERDKSSWQEKALRRVHDGCLKSLRVDVEAEADHDDVDDKKHDVQQEEDNSDGFEARKGKWYWGSC